jgi:hypothetical protein
VKSLWRRVGSPAGITSDVNVYAVRNHEGNRAEQGIQDESRMPNLADSRHGMFPALPEVDR